MPSYNNKFYTFALYAQAKLNDLFTEEQIADSYQREARILETSYFENIGHGKFKRTSLPNEAQVAPVYGLSTADFNFDGNLDLVLCGNSFSNHFEFGKLDALRGLILLGDGQGNWLPANTNESGLYAPYDAKALAALFYKKNQTIAYFIANNNGPIQVFESDYSDKNVSVIDLEESDSYARLISENGKIRKQEFYLGSGYLSQNTRKLIVGADVKSVEIYNSQGEMRDLKMLSDGE
jgi:hypothetical protein